MGLPADFHFSQASLQDYVDCARRFQLRHLLHLAWPALEAEPALESERHLQQGAAFHRLVHQHGLGVPAERLSVTVTDDDLQSWWDNYLAEPPAGLPASRFFEIVLSAPIGSQPGDGPNRWHRLVAKYDLVAVDPGRRAVIVDWKTSRRRPRRGWLADRLQTRVYPYLLVQAGSQLNGGQPVQPEQVEMVYWFSNFPADPERFAYDAAQYRADEVYLASLVERIADQADDLSLSRSGELEGGRFPLTAQKRRCRFCPYRSLCRRGVSAGALHDFGEEGEPVAGVDFGPELDLNLDLDLDFEQIAEVEY